MTGLAAPAAGESLEFGRFRDAVKTIIYGAALTAGALLTGNIALTELISARGFGNAMRNRLGATPKYCC